MATLLIHEMGAEAATLNAVAFNSVWQYVSTGRGSVVNMCPRARVA
jgi:hypothetical protein